MLKLLFMALMVGITSFVGSKVIEPSVMGAILGGALGGIAVDLLRRYFRK